MLESALITSLKILFVYAAMKEGNILFWLRRLIDWMISPLPASVYLMLRKPLFDCLFCMSSVWGIIFAWDEAFIYRFGWDYIHFLITVAGINYLIQSVLSYFEWPTEENIGQVDDDEIRPGDTIEVLNFYLNGRDGYYLNQYRIIPKVGDRFIVKHVSEHYVYTNVGKDFNELYFERSQIKKVK